MRITTFNINSIRARLPWLGAWLDDRQPDVVCFQETKCTDEQFPYELFDTRGYEVAVHGQKSYNGVAIASRRGLEDVKIGLPFFDEDARGIGAIVGGIRIVNLYVVNGKKVGEDAWKHKLAWLDALADKVTRGHSPGEHLVLCGDWNIAPQPRDTHDPKTWEGGILCSPEERQRFQRLLDWGLVDAWRHLHPDDEGRYTHTWWPYWAKSFERGLGVRIDHFLVSQPVLARTTAVEIDREARKDSGGEAKPSDHAPVTLVLSD